MAMAHVGLAREQRWGAALGGQVRRPLRCSSGTPLEARRSNAETAGAGQPAVCACDRASERRAHTPPGDGHLSARSPASLRVGGGHWEQRGSPGRRRGWWSAATGLRASSALVVLPLLLWLAPSTRAENSACLNRAHCEYAAPLSKYVCGISTDSALIAASFSNSKVFLLCTLGATSGCTGASSGSPECELAPGASRDSLNAVHRTVGGDPHLASDVQAATGMTETQLTAAYGMSTEEFASQSTSAYWKAAIATHQCTTMCTGTEDTFARDCLDLKNTLGTVKQPTDDGSDVCDHRACASSLAAIKQALMHGC